MISHDVVLSASGLGKRYLISHLRVAEEDGFVNALMARDLRTMLRSACSAVMRKRSESQDQVEDLWALREIDFEITRGEVVGIIGCNGAGKSTLLKILSRITEPTVGRAEIRGRVASLLEVGTGFHPELTGRENIFLNGAILGMSRAEIRAQFDEIVSFADVERFLDTPVKRYSSGMYVRLAFAVAAQLKPEILIVDEVLAVGDANFQRKSMGKMHDAATHGRTVLFVSHNMMAVERLCSRVLLLESGRVVMDGPAKNVIAEYLQTSGSEMLECFPDTDPSRIAEVRHIVLCDSGGVALKEVTTAVLPHLRIQLQVRQTTPDLKIAFSLHDAINNAIFSSCPPDDGVQQPIQAGMHEYFVSFPQPLFLARRYSITVSVYTSNGESIHNCLHALEFETISAVSRVYSAEPNRVGVLQLHCCWKHNLMQRTIPDLVKDDSSAV